MACESATLSLLGGLRSLPGDLRSFAILILAPALLPAVNADLASSAFPAEALLPVVNAAAPGALAPLKIVPTNNGVDLRDCQEL